MDCVADIVSAVREEYLTQIWDNCSEVCLSYGASSQACFKELASPKLHFQVTLSSVSRLMRVSIHNTNTLPPYQISSMRDAPVVEAIMTLLELDPDVMCAERDTMHVGSLLPGDVVMEYTFGPSVVEKVQQAYDPQAWALPFAVKVFDCHSEWDLVEFNYAANVLHYMFTKKIDKREPSQVLPLVADLLPRVVALADETDPEKLSSEWAQIIMSMHNIGSTS